MTEFVRCGGCGFEGRRGEVFQSEGHDPVTGRLHYRCPSCRERVWVDAASVLAPSRSMLGLPLRSRRVPDAERAWPVSFLGIVAAGLLLLATLRSGMPWWGTAAVAGAVLAAWFLVEIARERTLPQAEFRFRIPLAR